MKSVEEIWAEHRRFIVAAGCGGAVFLLGLSAIAGIDAQASRAARENRRVEREIEDLADFLEGREAYEAGLAEALARDVGPSVRAGVEFVPRAEFRPPAEGVSPYLAYHEALEKVKATRAEAVRRGLLCPEDLGLVAQPPEDRIKEALALADLVDRVLGVVLESGARRIDAIRPGDAEYVLLAAAGDEAAPPADALALRRLAVRIEVVGEIGAIESVLAAVARPGKSLEVGGASIARAAAPGGPGPGDGLLRLSVEFAGVSLVPATEARFASEARGAVGPSGRRGLLPRGGTRR
jgi:hypothetical protein